MAGDLWRHFNAHEITSPYGQLRIYREGWNWLREQPPTIFRDNIWGLLLEEPYRFHLQHGWHDLRRFEIKRPNLLRQHMPLTTHPTQIVAENSSFFLFGPDPRPRSRAIAGFAMIVRTPEQNWLPWYWNADIIPRPVAEGESVTVDFGVRRVIITVGR